MDELIVYWRQGESVQNFGDFLSLYLFEELFLPVPLYSGRTYLIGSVIADFLVPVQTAMTPSVVFWGCGAREAVALSPEAMAKARILAVRGPLTASALNLGAAVPQGDPALLLPALYAPRPAASAGRSVCIPHFWDDRSDEEQLAMSGCEQVLRPNVPNSRRRLLEMIDAIVGSDFVLSASLHGAIVAAAYGRPFAFWDNGHLDVPFKWRDTAALLNIPAAFATDLATGRAIHRDQLAPALRIPSLSPLLFNAPFPLRPEAVLRVLAHEGRAGDEPDARLLDWSGRLAAGGLDAPTALQGLRAEVARLRKHLHALDQELPFLRQELVQAAHRAHEAEAGLEMALRGAEDMGRALTAARADAAEAREAAALVSTQRDDAEGRAADAERRITDAVGCFADAERRITDADGRVADAERRAAEALGRLAALSSDLASSLDLAPDAEPQAIVRQVHSAFEGLGRNVNDARAWAADLEIELKAVREDAVLKANAFADMTLARDEALSNLAQIVRSEVRLREDLRSATVRREYESRFVDAAKSERRAARVEMEALGDRVSRAVSERDGIRAEAERLRADLDVARADLHASVLLNQQARGEVEALRSELDRKSVRLQQDTSKIGRFTQELQLASVQIKALEAELIGLNATTTVRAMRWLALKAPPPEGLKRVVRRLAQVLARRLPSKVSR